MRTKALFFQMRVFCLCLNANGKAEDENEGKSEKYIELLPDEETLVRTPCKRREETRISGDVSVENLAGV